MGLLGEFLTGEQLERLRHRPRRSQEQGGQPEHADGGATIDHPQQHREIAAGGIVSMDYLSGAGAPEPDEQQDGNRHRQCDEEAGDRSAFEGGSRHERAPDHNHPQWSNRPDRFS